MLLHVLVLSVMYYQMLGEINFMFQLVAVNCKTCKTRVNVMICSDPERQLELEHVVTRDTRRFLAVCHRSAGPADSCSSAGHYTAPSVGD